jgi:hypothetical protein
MNLQKKFQEDSSSQVIRVNTMEVNKKYPIIGAERITTNFGFTVVMHIKEQPIKVVNVYLPKPYSAIVSDEDIELINSQKVSLYYIREHVKKQTLTI